MGNSCNKHFVASGSQAVFSAPDFHTQHIRGILSEFLKNYRTAELYGLTPGTKIMLGQSFCTDIPQGKLSALPREFHFYKRGNLIEIGRCIIKIDEMESFCPCLNYSNYTNAALIEIHDELRR